MLEDPGVALSGPVLCAQAQHVVAFHCEAIGEPLQRTDAWRAKTRIRGMGKKIRRKMAIAERRIQEVGGGMELGEMTSLSSATEQGSSAGTLLVVSHWFAEHSCGSSFVRRGGEG